MSEFFEYLKRLFGLSDEQVQKAEEELKNAKKSETESKETAGNQENENKKVETVENVATTSKKEEIEKTEPVGDKLQTAGASSNTDKEVEKMSFTAEEYKKLEAELAAVKGILEKQNAEKAAADRMNKIKEFKDCLDYDYLGQLLDGVEEKDFGAKVEAIKKDKSYLFKAPDTKGFNPATPQNTMDEVTAAFYDFNHDIRPGS